MSFSPYGRVHHIQGRPVWRHSPLPTMPMACVEYLSPCAALLLQFLRRSRTNATLRVSSVLDGTVAADGKALSIAQHGCYYPPMFVRTSRMRERGAEPLRSLVLRTDGLSVQESNVSLLLREAKVWSAECILNLFELAVATRSPALLYALADGIWPEQAHIDAAEALGWRWTRGGYVRDGLQLTQHLTELADPLVTAALDLAFQDPPPARYEPMPGHWRAP